MRVKKREPETEKRPKESIIKERIEEKRKNNKERKNSRDYSRQHYIHDARKRIEI